MRLNGIGACLDLLDRLTKSADRRTAVQFVVVMGERERGSQFTADGDARTFGVAFPSAAADRRQGKDQGPQASPIGLTDREKEVLTWVARGTTSADIATILGLKERTINFHCDNAMKRLDVINRTQAVAKAVAEELIGI